VGKVGLGWFDPNDPGNLLEVYNSSGALLDSAPIPTAPIGGVFAAFRGIQETSNDIVYAVAQVSEPDDVYGIDNVTFGTVPEPGSLGVLLAGGAALLFRRWRSVSARTERVEALVGSGTV